MHGQATGGNMAQGSISMYREKGIIHQSLKKKKNPTENVAKWLQSSVSVLSTTPCRADH